MIYKWFSKWTLLTLPFVVSPFVIGGMLFVEAYTETPGRIMGSIPVLCFSLLLAYTSLAYLLNETEIKVEKNHVKVVHGPIPWEGISFHLAECEEFLAGKITESRFPKDGLRVRLKDQSYYNLSYANSRDDAEDWAELLNTQLRQGRFLHNGRD